MYKNKKVLCIIPARSGSKGLKNKNILRIKNKELLYYPINAALKSKYIDYVLFSSESKKFIKIAKKYNANCPFVRPKKYSTDNSTSFQVIKHGIIFLEKFERKKFDYIVCLEPTSPLTTNKDVDEALKQIICSGATSLVSVMKSDKFSISYHFIMDKNYQMLPAIRNKDYKKRRQLIKNTYILDGSLYIAKIRDYFKYQGFFTPKTIGKIMPKIKNFEIDDALDYKIIKSFLEK